MNVFLILLTFALVYLAFFSASLFWRFKKDKFLAADADRCLNRSCEVEENTIQEFERRGYLYTKGLTVIEEDGKKRFVKQAKIIF